MPEPVATTCRNCDRPLEWHRVAQKWTHAGASTWCFPERQGYDQPQATP